jgi:hypothetical protein
MEEKELNIGRNVRSFLSHKIQLSRREYGRLRCIREAVDE